MRQRAQLGDGIKPPPVVAVPTTPPLADDVANTAPGGHAAEQLGSAPFDARGTDCGKKRSCGSSADAAALKMPPAVDWGARPPPAAKAAAKAAYVQPGASRRWCI